jgi:hypothetical protein
LTCPSPPQPLRVGSTPPPARPRRIWPPDDDDRVGTALGGAAAAVFRVPVPAGGPTPTGRQRQRSQESYGPAGRRADGPTCRQEVGRREPRDDARRGGRPAAGGDAVTPACLVAHGRARAPGRGRPSESRRRADTSPSLRCESIAHGRRGPGLAGEALTEGHAVTLALSSVEKAEPEADER